MSFRYADNLVLGGGLIILAFLTYFILPRIYQPLQFSPSYITLLSYGNLVASGILFVMGIVFVVFAYNRR